MTPALRVDRLCFGYGKEPNLLNQVGFSLPAGTFLGIVGPNGAGKTTLLRLLCAELRAHSGSILLDGTLIGELSHGQRARKMAVVRQLSLPAFGYTVAETVMMARILHLGARGFESSRDRSVVRQALCATDTERLANRALTQLSGGERQRVYIARALAQETPLLLLDEPTSSLDLRHQIAIHELLKTAQREQQRTIIAITHDLNLAAQYSDTMLLLGGRGSAGFVGTPREVLSEARLEEVFGIKIGTGIVEGQRVFVPVGRLSSS